MTEQHQPKTRLLMVDFERARQIILATEHDAAEAAAKEQGVPFDPHTDKREWHQRAFATAAAPGTIWEMFEQGVAQFEENGFELFDVTYGHDGKYPVFIGVFKPAQEQSRILTMGGGR